jgi:phosphate:Na+ symporter
MADTSSSLARQIANAHTVFNIATSVILWPFIGTIAWASERLVPKKDDEEAKTLTEHIDESLYRFPDIALVEANKELVRIGEITAEMITLSRQTLLENDQSAGQRVLELENEMINPLCATLEGFISELMQENLTQEQVRQCLHLKEMITDVERVSDLTDDLVQVAQGGVTPSEKLAAKEMAELDRLFHQTHRTYRLALQAVRDGDRSTAQVVSQMEEKMDRRYWKARKKVSKRLNAGKIDSEADTIYVELLRNLERISDHADGLSISVMRS